MILFTALLLAGNSHAISDEARLAYEQGDYITAKILLAPAAREGSALAQYFLGYMAYMGFAQNQDKKQAADWFQKAAIQNHAEAYFALGLLARDEPAAGLQRDRAKEYFSKAAKLGHQAARQYIEE